jgi:putative tricarboxylic transport membrane protein
MKRMILSLVAAVVYTLLLKSVGFFVMTILFIFAVMLVLGKRKPLSLVLVPIGTTVGVWFVFEKVLSIGLPPGILAGLPI